MSPLLPLLLIVTVGCATVPAAPTTLMDSEIEAAPEARWWESRTFVYIVGALVIAGVAVLASNSGSGSSSGGSVQGCSSACPEEASP